MEKEEFASALPVFPVIHSVVFNIVKTDFFFISEELRLKGEGLRLRLVGLRQIPHSPFFSLHLKLFPIRECADRECESSVPLSPK